MKELQELFSMRTRKLGFTGEELTVIGSGTWAMGGPWEYGWGPQDDDQAIGAILKGLDQGINWIDTAAIYGLGHSEELVGKALKQTRQKPFIATKCGLRWDEQHDKIGCLGQVSLEEECDDSLKRLGVEVIDLMQIHWPDPDEGIEPAMEMLAKLVEIGKIRYVGVSNFSLEQIKRARAIHPVASVQPPYSMIRREAETQLFEYCAEHEIGIVVYSPMQCGLLTGKFSHERMAGLPTDDHRWKKPEFKDPEFTATLEMVDQLRPIAERNNKTLAQLAISWVLRRSEVTAAIVGARNPKQIEETARAGDWQLSEEDINQIEDMLTARTAKI